MGRASQLHKAAQDAYFASGKDIPGARTATQTYLALAKVSNEISSKGDTCVSLNGTCSFVLSGDFEDGSIVQFGSRYGTTPGEYTSNAALSATMGTSATGLGQYNAEEAATYIAANMTNPIIGTAFTLSFSGNHVILTLTDDSTIKGLQAKGDGHRYYPTYTFV